MMTWSLLEFELPSDTSIRVSCPGENLVRVGAAHFSAGEAELMRENIFFKPVLNKGAQIARNESTATSAQNVIRLILDNHPLPLRIREELVNEHKDISGTGAGEELNRELTAQTGKRREGMRVLREEMQEAIRNKDEEIRRELEIETQKMQREIAGFENDSKRLASDYKEKERLEARLVQMEEEARQEADRIVAQCQGRINDLRDTLRTNTAASETERTQMLQQINELTRRSAQAHSGLPAGVGILSMIGEALEKVFPR
jgi:hypothetical protein